MRLLLVRHAQAAPGEPDALRELTPVGELQARELGTQLADAGVRPGAILTSPLLRARQTADALARSLGVEAEIEEGLAPGATSRDVRAAAAGRGEVVLVVGHQPDLGHIAAELAGGPEPAFPPGGMASVDLDG